MSVQSLMTDLTRCQREISSLESRRAGFAKQRAEAMRKASEAQKRANASSTPSSVQSYFRDAQRHQDDAAKAAQREAEVARDIATQNEKIARYQEHLQKEQLAESKRSQKQSDRFQESLRKRQEELERSQSEQLRQFHKVISHPADTGGDSHAAATTVQHDVFVSHASEDKDEFVRPLVATLTERGLNVWYDEFQLKVGDSLRRSIDRGLRDSRFGIVVLSESFFKKNWPQHELDGLVAREMSGGKVILPIWHKVTKDQVLGYSPTLADKLALNTSTMTLAEIAEQLTSVIRP